MLRILFFIFSFNLFAVSIEQLSVYHGESPALIMGQAGFVQYDGGLVFIDRSKKTKEYYIVAESAYEQVPAMLKNGISFVVQEAGGYLAAHHAEVIANNYSDLFIERDRTIRMHKFEDCSIIEQLTENYPANYAEIIRSVLCIIAI